MIYLKIATIVCAAIAFFGTIIGEKTVPTTFIIMASVFDTGAVVIESMPK